MGKPVWNLRYASHLGYLSLEMPLFKASVGGLDPIAHIRFAAELGLAGVIDPLALMRTAEEQSRIGDALVRHGLEGGTILYAPPDIAISPLWGRSDETSSERIEGHLQDAFEAARRANSNKIVIVSGCDDALPRPVQYAAAIRNLRRAGEMAMRADMLLCVEGISAKTIPGMLFGSLLDTYMVVNAVDCPAVRLVFDTAHVQSADGDLIANLERVWDAVGIVQICDSPGRVEPGQGEINMAGILKRIHDRGYCGLVELEHDWASPGIDAERGYLETLQQMDAQAALP